LELARPKQKFYNAILSDPLNKPKMLSFLKPVTVRSVCIKSKFWLLTLKLDGYKPFGNWYVDGILEGGLPNTMAI
jgi:hypothetical protein